MQSLPCEMRDAFVLSLQQVRQGLKNGRTIRNESSIKIKIDHPDKTSQLFNKRRRWKVLDRADLSGQKCNAVRVGVVPEKIDTGNPENTLVPVQLLTVMEKSLEYFSQVLPIEVDVFTGYQDVVNVRVYVR